ncbi:MAG: 7-cyano-7-deazaguanine synthase [Phycisphaerae bacterium]
MESAVILLSGGMASATAAFRRRESTKLHPLYLDCGTGAAKMEIKAAADLAEFLKARLTVLELPHVAEIARQRHRSQPAQRRQRPAPLTGPDDIPGLHPVLLSVGAEFAAAMGAQWLVTGHSAPSHDTTGQQLSQERRVDPREFHHAFAAMLETALPTVRAVRLECPLMDLTPGDIIKLANRFSVPLVATWSCHTAAAPCGTCRGCLSRADAFAHAGRADPLLAPTAR